MGSVGSSPSASTARKTSDVYIVDPTPTRTMSRLSQKRAILHNCKNCMFAKDVTFQQCNLQSNKMQEGKVSFSSKQKLYDFNAE